MATDSELIRIVDAAMAEAVRRSGAWIACQPGCTQCCLGPFPITMLDAARLRSGLAELDRGEPLRAAAVRARARRYIARLADFPGDAETGVLVEDAEFGDALDEAPCPALDPDSGTCDLYAWRPLTCRMFGPAVSAGGDVLGVCGLCYEGASDGQIAACRVSLDTGALETELQGGDSRQTMVAFALR